jgi:hypothetical protein
MNCLAPRGENFGGHGSVAKNLKKNLKEGGVGLGRERAQRKRLGIIGLKTMLTVAGIFLFRGFTPLQSPYQLKKPESFVTINATSSYYVSFLCLGS